MWFVRRLLLSIVLAIVLAIAADADAGSKAEAPGAASNDEEAASTDLVRPGDLTYLGAFDIPPGRWQDPKSRQYAYSLGAIAYSALGDSLYVTTHAHAPNYVGRFDVPESFVDTPVAQELNGAIELPKLDRDKDVRTRGLYFDERSGLLFYTQHIWYNVSAVDMPALGAIDPVTGTRYGPWWVGDNNKTAGPIAYNDTDRKLYMGLGGVAGAASTNQGPAAYEVDPFGIPLAGSRLPYTALLSHPHAVGKDTHEVMSTGERWWVSTRYWGAAVIGRTALYFVEEGEREFYGTGRRFRATYPKLTDCSGPGTGCPRSDAKGYHHDIYRPMVYFYDLQELDRVREGQLQAWDPKPYAYYRLPELPNGAYFGGAAVDYANRRLFVSQRSGNDKRAPRIHVYGW